MTSIGFNGGSDPERELCQVCGTEPPCGCEDPPMVENMPRAVLLLSVPCRYLSITDKLSVRYR